MSNRKNTKRTAVILALCLVITTIMTLAVPTGAVGTASYSVTDAKAFAGDTVEVYLSINDNPGIITLRCYLNYNEEALELVSVSDTGLLNGYTQPSPEISSPYILRWADGLARENNTYNGEFVKLTFKVKDGAAAGDYKVSVDHIEARTVTGERVTFETGYAFVTVLATPVEPSVLLGDLDGDGAVGIKDINIVKKLLSGAVVPTEMQRIAGDMNGDGLLNGLDGNRLAKYVSGASM